MSRRDQHPAAGTAAHGEALAAGHAPGPEVPPSGLAAAAGQMRQEAGALQEQAERDLAEAAELMAAARAEADRILGEATAAGRVLTAAARAAEQTAAGLAERARWLANAVAEEGRAAEAEARVSALEAEREHLAGQVAAIGGRLDELGTERRGADAQLAAAREAGDLEAMQELRGRLGAIGDLEAGLSGSKAAAQDRLGAIGDGTAGFPGEMASAIQAARGRRGAIRRILNDVWPGRPEAVQDRDREEYLATLAAGRQRIADEAKHRQPPRTLVL